MVIGFLYSEQVLSLVDDLIGFAHGELKSLLELVVHHFVTISGKCDSHLIWSGRPQCRLHHVEHLSLD